MIGRMLRNTWRYLSGVALVLMIVWGSAAIQRRWGIRFDSTALVILAMIGTAWFKGLGPGLLVAALFEVILDFYAYSSKEPTRWVVVFNRGLLFVSLVIFASTRRNAEIRLRKKRKALEDALNAERRTRQQAEAAGRVKDEFLATVSHELRTPLNAMVGWAALLTRHQADEAMTRRAAATIERNARAQANIVEDILDVSRIASGGIRITTRPIQVTPLIQDALESLRVTAKEKAISVEASLENDVVILGDIDRVRQIAWNLVCNAIKFTPPGGRVDVTLRRDQVFAELQVSDTGIGIPAEFLPHLFQRFQQADPSMARERAGLGLGLAIVRHLVELHEGTVEVESGGKDKGTTFTVRLPLTTEPAVGPAVSPFRVTGRDVGK